MNAAFNQDLRSQGGKSRDLGRDEWEAKFMGAVAGSSRPLKKDHPAATEPKLAVEILKSEAKRFPWIVLFVVCRDGRTVSSTLSEPEAVARINQSGGAVGMAGYLFLRDRRTPFVRPFVAGVDLEHLKALAEERWREAEKIVRLNEETNAPFSATVFTNGKRASIFYPWETPQVPKGWEQAGVLYVAPHPTGKGWQAKAQTQEKWEALMVEVTPLFEKKVKELIQLANKAGLSLIDLKLKGK